MAERTVFILSASSDIGRGLAERYLHEGATVVGTYRDRAGIKGLEGHERLVTLACDVGDPASVRAMLGTYAGLGRPWDLFVSAVGRLDPIGPFFQTDFDEWERSVQVNSTAQLRVLHGLYPHRRRGGVVHAAFFAGGGTNNAFTNFSAYCVSKIALIKMCELLDDEAQDLNVFILGPGFVPTKLHRPTLDNPTAAGLNHAKTVEFFRAGRSASYDDLHACIDWCMEAGRDVIGGRNLAAVHDPWRAGGALVDALRADRDKFKLRRHGNG